MERIARVLVGHSRVVLAATAVVSLVAAAMLFRVSLNADVSSFLLEGNATGEEFAALQATYETRDPVNVVASLPDGQTFRSTENLALVAELRDALLDVDGVDAVATVALLSRRAVREPAAITETRPVTDDASVSP